MSQFSFPRINLHGTVLLDTPTANNGNLEPTLTIYDQQDALPFLPPRCYLVTTPVDQKTYVQQNFPTLTIDQDASGNYYVPVLSINTTDAFGAWAITPIGSSNLDEDYWGLYNYLSDPSTGSPNPPIVGKCPGYWNYYGDLSVTLQNVNVVGVQLPLQNGTVATYTPSNTDGCPQVLQDIMGTTLSFNDDFFNPQARSTAVFCDVDSVGQTCTQIFCNKAGLYNTTNQETYFTGRPCKATTNWMSLQKLINWSSMRIVPMGGAASFYTTIKLNECDPDLQALFNQYAGAPVSSLFMKILIHQVHETRNPDYNLMPTTPIGSNQTSAPKNPAVAAFTASVCPWVEGDMFTVPLSRILKNTTPLSIDTTNIIAPIPKGSSAPLDVPQQISLGPSLINFNSALNLVSVDAVNTIPEYGTLQGDFPNYAGNGDVPPFTAFENYDFGQLDLYFQPDGGNAFLIGSVTHTADYNYQQFLATGGVFDFPVTGIPSFTNGFFYIENTTGKILVEDEYVILTEQKGTYAEQNTSTPSNGLYMNDGLPLVPINLRVLYRGEPVPQTAPVSGTMQSFSLATNIVTNTGFSLYDGVQFIYPVNQDGCLCYGFAATSTQLLNSNMSNIFFYLKNGYFITTRVLSECAQLLPYINGQQPITWQVLYNNIFINYQTILPIMNLIVSFSEEQWAEPVIKGYLAMLTQIDYWGDFNYMPVTRELSANQRQIIFMWASADL